MLTLTPEQFTIKLKQHEAEIKNLIDRDLPDIIGREAVAHFKLNFQNESWGRTKWKGTNTGWTRENVRADHKILTGTGNLGRSIQYSPETGRVIIHSDLDYSKIHNEGGMIRITDKMRKWAWAMFYTTKSENYKNLALTKKTHIEIPKRQFIGDDEELNKKIKAKIEERLNKIFSK